MKGSNRARRSRVQLQIVLAALLSSPLGALASADKNESVDFAAQFRNPPAESRIIKIIHSWPDEPARQDALIHTLSTQGFGGVVCNVSFSDYLQNEAKWNAFTRAVATAKQAGFALWLYDEKGYPSAAAGGLVLRNHPEWEARGLLIADREVEGNAAELELPPGAPKLIAAFPLANGQIDLRLRTNLAACVSTGKLSWQPPPGRWLVLAITEDRLYEGTHASLSLAEHLPYPNLLDPEPTARFLQLTHQGYADHLGENLGKDFISTFTDEPSLMSLFLRRMPYRVLPWSAGLSPTFQRQRGYNLEEKLPALVADAGLESARVRFDYWQTVGGLVADNYFGQIQRWCHAHHVLSGGHLLMEENLVNQVALYGDFFGCLRRLDAPSIDCLTSLPEQVPWYIARLAGSAADLERKTVTMCETSDHSQRYRPAGDKRPPQRVTPEEIRGTCNRLIVSGIDTITSYYSFDGLQDDELRRLNEYVGRCCCAVKGGHQAADIAVLYPIQSAWVRFTPSRHYANDCAAAARVETIFHDVSESLFAAGRDFTYVDERALAEAEPRQGVMVHEDLRWKVIVLPGADTLPMKAWRNLERFVAGGGVLISIGAVPRNSEKDFPSAEVEAIGRQVFGGIKGPEPAELGSRTNSAGGGGIVLPAGLASLMPLMLDSVLERDFEANGNHSAVRYTHRRIGGKEVYFVINDSRESWSGSVSFCAAGAGEMWDPATGEASGPVGASKVSLKLAPFGASLFRFIKSQSPRRLNLGQHLLPNFMLREVPAAKPAIGRGEFVREELAAVGAEPLAGGEKTEPIWRVAGTITKSQVDTFLFTTFAAAGCLAVPGSHSLVLDTWVPEGQKSPTQMLVILHEKDGADYLAHAGRLLNAAGHERSWIPWTRFQLAGWSKDRNGQLDLDQVTDIRIGWGGYLGSEGERIEFSLAQPQIGALSPAR